MSKKAETIRTHDNWLSGVTAYLEKPVLVVILLGFSAGLPLALSGSTLFFWMRTAGVDLASIGLFSLTGLPYTLKFIWAPVVDAWNVPFLTKRLGRRRGWLVATQIVLIITIVALGSLDPSTMPIAVALAALILATASATQDVVIDAFRVESLDPDRQAAGMAGYVAAYRIAMLVSGGGVIALAAWLETRGVAAEDIWFWGYAAAAMLMLIGIGAVIWSSEPETDITNESDSPALSRLLSTAAGAFSDLIKQPLIIPTLGFIVLFKFCDSLAGVMTAPFVVDLGYDKAAYAGIVKGVGTIAVLAGGIAGGIIARQLPLLTSLWIAGIAQIVSNLLFAWLATRGVDHTALAATIAVENIAGGIGTVIFVAYLSGLCANPMHTATQFAVLTALAATGRTVLTASAGYLAEAAGWPLFFAITACAGTPGLVLLAWLAARGHFARLKDQRVSELT